MNSMTGFGRAEHTHGQYTATVELSSVNRKQAEIVLSTPRSLNEHDAYLRKSLLSKISRGRVSASIRLELADTATPELAIDESRLTTLKSALNQLSSELGQPISTDLASLLRIPDLLSFETEIPANEALTVIQPALDQALKNLLKTRSEEGQNLATDITERLNLLEGLLQEAETLSPEVLKHHHEALRSRLEETGLPLPLDDERLLKEIAILSDRCDISEETTRLHSHFKKFREDMAKGAKGDAVGRPLDFLCQEINREWNTIGSKANNATLAHLVVTAKTELEKIREQIQNIE